MATYPGKNCKHSTVQKICRRSIDQTGCATERKVDRDLLAQWQTSIVLEIWFACMKVAIANIQALVRLLPSSASATDLSGELWRKICVSELLAICRHCRSSVKSRNRSDWSVPVPRLCYVKRMFFTDEQCLSQPPCYCAKQPCLVDWQENRYQASSSVNPARVFVQHVMVSVGVCSGSKGWFCIYRWENHSWRCILCRSSSSQTRWGLQSAAFRWIHLPARRRASQPIRHASQGMTSGQLSEIHQKRSLASEFAGPKAHGFQHCNPGCDVGGLSQAASTNT